MEYGKNAISDIEIELMIKLFSAFRAECSPDERIYSRSLNGCFLYFLLISWLS